MPIFEYLGPFDGTEVDEGPVVQGGTIEVTDERAPSFASESWREVKKHKKPRPGAEDTPTENTKES